MTQYAILYNASHFDIHNLRTYTNCKLSYFVREKVFILVFVYEPEFFVFLFAGQGGETTATQEGPTASSRWEPA